MNKKKKYSIVLIGIFFIIFVLLKNINLFNKSDANLPIVYLKEKSFYVKNLQGEIKELKDISKVIGVLEDNKIYYVDLEGNLCFYDKKFTKQIIDIQEYDSEIKNISIIKSPNLKKTFLDLEPISELKTHNNPLISEGGIYMINEKEKIEKISSDAELKAITKDSKVIYVEKNQNLMLLNEKNQKLIISENIKESTLIWDELYQKLIFLKEDNENFLLNVWDSNKNQIYEVAKIKKELNFINNNSIMFVNENQLTFSVSNLGRKQYLYITDLKGQVKEIESQGNYQLRDVKRLNNGDANIDKVNKINNIYYFKEEKGNSLFKVENLYSYDITSGNVERLSENGEIKNKIGIYNDKLFYWNDKKEVIKLDIRNNDKNIIVKNFDWKYLTNGVESSVGISSDKLWIKDENVYTFSNGTLSINDKIILENVERILNKDFKSNTIYLIHEGKLKLIDKKGKDIKILIEEVNGIDDIYIYNENFKLAST